MIYSVYLRDDEYARFRHIGETALADKIVGLSTLTRIAVLAFLGDELPEWAEQLLRELTAA